MKANLTVSTFIIAAVLLFTACDERCLVERHVNIPQAAWHKDSTATVVVPVTDTLSHCAIVLAFRNSDDYPYSNVILAVTATAPSGATVCDTVEYRLVDDANDGWNGRTGGKWVDHRLAFRTNVQFLQSGDYHFGIAHLMRRDELPGVGAVGVRIERIEEY